MVSECDSASLEGAVMGCRGLRCARGMYVGSGYGTDVHATARGCAALVFVSGLHVCARSRVVVEVVEVVEDGVGGGHV
jgi:hypothetical protein